jgi:pyruvate,water dikinase
MRRFPVDVDELVARQRLVYQEAWDRLVSHSPRVARRLRVKIEESARRGRMRELARSAYTRDRWAIRLFALRAGRLTGLDDRIFYLTLNEVLALLSGDRSVIAVIEPRVDAYQAYKELPSYPPIIRGYFDPFAWAADPDRPTDIFNASQPGTMGLERGCLFGSPGSTGVVEGCVRIIDDPGSGDQFKEGEILVAIQTDIAWTLLFPRALAVITDIGAPLSHAAIIARELGIPAVVGCGNATGILKTGDRVRVDGANGTVEILEQST